MGWGRGTRIFDEVVGSLLISNLKDKDFDRIVVGLLDVLERMDWDNLEESPYIYNPRVNKIIRERYPSWFEEE